MCTARVIAGWSAIVLVSGLGAACATGGASSATDGLMSQSPAERQALRDSAKAQAIADEVGPRVSVSADFDYASGTRRVDATFHMYDDAYVIVGSLDAGGRLSIVFPSAPGDDGFVRGDEIYHVPSFFAGFNDEYQWRYSNYYYQTHSSGARRDSYDAGLGYVFVIASWRPMRLDRITDGNHWARYEVSDINYMSDPREAVDELGSLVAGDNREAYTIEYAHYTTTNYGTYAYSDFDRLNSGCASSYSAWPFGGYSFFSPLPYSPFGAFGFNSAGCGNAYSYYPGFYAFGGYPRYAPGSVAPPIIAPPVRPRVPIGSPIFRLPENGGGIAFHAPTTGTGINVGANGSLYRRPGLIAEDAAGSRGRVERQPVDNGMTISSHRPNIQDMVGRRPTENGFRNFSPRTGEAGVNSSAGHSYGGQRTYSPASHGTPTHATGAGSASRGGGGSARSAPAPTHVAPATHSAPPPSSSSSGSKKS